MSNSRTKQKQLNRSIGMIPPADSAGTVSTGVTASEEGDGRNHSTVLTLNTALGAIVGGTNLGLGVQVYAFPAGEIIINSAYMSVALQQTEGNITADTPEVGVGTVVASGAITALNGTATFEEIITGTAAADCDGTATVLTEISNSGTGILIPTADAHTVFFNAADGWAASGDAACGVVGTVHLNWTMMS